MSGHCGGQAQLERLAIEVPDLDVWIRAFEALLGAGFERHTVAQATGDLDIAVHPAGVELVLAGPDGPPRLRSFHLRTADLSAAADTARRLGWTDAGTFSFRGAEHRAFNAQGLRLILLAAEESNRR